MKEQVLKEISDREHVLLRPGRYIGQINIIKEKRLIFKDNKLQWKDVEFSPGLLKIIREVLDNCVDEHVRTNSEFANKIDISIKDNYIIISDNGRGIPDKKENDICYAELAWCKLKAGGNFEDSDDSKIGQNGEGVCLTNIFSKEFIGETCDGKTKVKLVSKNNLESYEIKRSKCRKRFTKVSFLPDYEKFGYSKLEKIYEDLIITEILNLSIVFPKIKFTFNNKPIIKGKITFKKYLGLFNEKFEFIETNGLKIAVLPSDEFLFYHNINGIYVKNGGESLNWVVNKISNKLSSKFKRKYKSIKPSDIYNKLKFVVFFTNMKAPRFGDQVKQLCINKYSYFKNSIGEIDFDKFVNKVYRNKELIANIIDYFIIKEKVKEKQLLKKKTKKKIISNKYMPSIKNFKYLMLCEGDSACGLLSRVIGRKDAGFYAMRGKILNVLTAKIQKIISNKEINEIKDILEIDLSKGIGGEIPYDKIVFATDADFDGISIQSLLLTFFYKFAPDLIKNGKICLLRTPIVILFKNKKIKHVFFTIDKFNNFASKNDISKFELKYYKGLGSFRDETLNEVFENGGLDRYIEPLIFETEEELDEIIKWMDDKNIEFRKEKIIKKDFSIDLI